MSWQDVVLTIGGFVFSAALVPAIFSKNKPPLATCLITGAVLVAYACTYFSLSLWLSTVSISILALLWLTLAFLVYAMRSSQVLKSGKN